MANKFILLPPLKRSTELLSSLLSLWETSVRASHFFLSEADIQALIPLVRGTIQQIPILVVAMENDQPVGFMGIEGEKLEMLFVLPEYFGKGIGKELVRCALDQYGVTKVDVNEQNPHAAEFYRRMGFRLSHRSELDGQGNPFPVLHLVLADHHIVQATLEDLPEILELFKSTVLNVNRKDYTQAEVEDWASCGKNVQKMEIMIRQTHYFIVAKNPQGKITGFSSITPEGYLHSMFVHKDFQNQGVASLLLDEIERYAAELGLKEITSEVSITARPFFEKRGYVVDAEQKRKANQLFLTNFRMARRDFQQKKLKK